VLPLLIVGLIVGGVVLADLVNWKKPQYNFTPQYEKMQLPPWHWPKEEEHWPKKDQQNNPKMEDKDRQLVH
jgi:hypothetical protein